MKTTTVKSEKDYREMIEATKKKLNITKVASVVLWVAVLVSLLFLSLEILPDTLDDNTFFSVYFLCVIFSVVMSMSITITVLGPVVEMLRHRIKTYNNAIYELRNK